jgi:hypothetical protein
MCGSLKRENKSDEVGKDPQSSWLGPGNHFTIVDHEGEAEAMFNKHAQQETLRRKWLDHGWKRGDLYVQGYTERGRKFEVPKGYVLDVVVRTIPGQGKIFNIVTRPARGAENEVHDRFPILKRPRF